MTRTMPRAPAAAIVFVALLAGSVPAACHRQPPKPPGDPLLDTIRTAEQPAGLTYAEGQGKHLFEQYCATCHGDEGKGDGQNASNLNPPPPDLRASKSARDPAYLQQVIAEGSAAVGRSPLSPPWGRSLSRQDIDYLVAYCAALARKP
jgi:mono/diheme cytochrome c family protein